MHISFTFVWFPIALCTHLYVINQLWSPTRYHLNSKFHFILYKFQISPFYRNQNYIHIIFFFLFIDSSSAISCYGGRITSNCCLCFWCLSKRKCVLITRSYGNLIIILIPFTFLIRLFSFFITGKWSRMDDSRTKEMCNT